MKKKTIISTAVSTAITMATVAGIAFASTDTPAGNAVDPYPGQGTVKFDSLRVGDVAKGGVLFGNGTWVNEGGALTIGDHLRVDGNIHRGPEFGINKGDNKPLRFNDEVVSMGTHTFEQGLDFKKVDSGTTPKADFNNVDVINFPSSSHTHDDRYFTESEVTSLLGNKADTSHTHDDRYYTESEVDAKLSTKANSADVYTKTESDANFVKRQSLNVYAASAPGTFFPIDSTVPYASGSGNIGQTTGSSEVFVASIPLVRNDYITSYGVEANAGGTAMTVKLFRRKIGETTRTQIGSTQSSVGGAGIETISETLGTPEFVDDGYNYEIEVLIPSGSYFLYGSIVTYSNNT